MKLFKSKQNKVETISKAEIKSRPMHEIVQEIHDKFYSEVDVLLQESEQLDSLDSQKQDLINKYERLKNLGFQNTLECQEAKEELDRLNDLKKNNSNKESLNRAIKYFSQKYPLYKFITEDSVKKICEKYNLIYGEVQHFKGVVPDKNLTQMENFKIQEEDACYSYTTRYKESWRLRGDQGICKHNYKLDDYRSTLYDFFINKCPLEIAAPPSDFNLDQMKIEDFKITQIKVEDPVVLQPVIFENQKHYLIVTAWGPEASDKEVVNHIMN